MEWEPEVDVKVIIDIFTQIVDELKLIPYKIYFQKFDVLSDRENTCTTCPGQNYGCLFFGNEGDTMTWDEARKFCADNNARLVEPTDPYMGRVIANLFPYDYPPQDGKTYNFQQKIFIVF